MEQLRTSQFGKNYTESIWSAGLDFLSGRSRVQGVESTDEPHAYVDVYSACCFGDMDYIYYLQENEFNKVDFSAKNKGGWTPLMYASYFGHRHIVNFLLERKINVHDKTIDGRTALALAVSCGQNDVVETLVKSGCELEARDNRDWTALFHAVHLCQHEVLKTLLKLGANPNVVERRFGTTPLMLAAKQGLELIVQTLLDFRANPAITSNIGETALGLANAQGATKIVLLLQKHQQKQLGAWPTDLASLFNLVGLQKYYPIFVKEEIDLQVFLTMNEDNLKAIGIERLGPRKKMISAIKRWHENGPVNNTLEQAYADKLYRELQETQQELVACRNEVKSLEKKLVSSPHQQSLGKQTKHIMKCAQEYCQQINSMATEAQLLLTGQQQCQSSRHAVSTNSSATCGRNNVTQFGPNSEEAVGVIQNLASLTQHMEHMLAQ